MEPIFLRPEQECKMENNHNKKERKKNALIQIWDKEVTLTLYEIVLDTEWINVSLLIDDINLLCSSFLWIPENMTCVVAWESPTSGESNLRQSFIDITFFLSRIVSVKRHRHVIDEVVMVPKRMVKPGPSYLTSTRGGLNPVVNCRMGGVSIVRQCWPGVFGVLHCITANNPL